MPLAPSPLNVYLGRGKTYAALWAGAVQGVWRDLGNVEKIDIQTTDTLKDLYESMDPTSGLYARALTRRVIEASLTFDELTPPNLALLLMGSTSYLTQVGTAITGEDLTTDVVLGAIYQTAKRGPITSVTLEQSPSTALVLGTDYSIYDATFGLIEILPTSVTVTPGSTITISYTPTAYTGATGVSPSVIAGGSQGKIEIALKFIGNPVTGPQLILDIWKAYVQPGAAVQLLGDEFGTGALKLQAEYMASAHPTAPYYQILDMDLTN